MSSTGRDAAELAGSCVMCQDYDHNWKGMFFERNAQEAVKTFVPDHTDVKQVRVCVCVCVSVCVCEILSARM